MQEKRGETVTRVRTHFFVLTAIITIALDQLSKWAAIHILPAAGVELIAGVVRLRVTRNPGGAFGIFPSATLFFVLAGVAIVGIVIFWWTRRHEGFLPLGLILGGGLGNLVDRLVQSPGPLRGNVVDFIDVGFWPTFNLADSAIVVGVGLLLLSGLRSGQK